MFYRLVRGVLYIVFRFYFKIKTEGLENLPKGQGCIVASNHRSNFDPIFIAISIKGILTFMAKAELFRLPFIGHMFTWVKAFPVERGSGDTGAVDFAIDSVREGKVLAMFPEGTRSKDGKLGRAKSGCAVIAGAAKAPVVPVAVCYGEHLRFRDTITVRFGKVIDYRELGVVPERPSTIKAGSKLIMSRIAELLYRDGEQEGVAL